jgi:lipid II:glycine glycyltransferase (peptidoglycan interpeptide bridge formation enzyme)
MAFLRSGLGELFQAVHEDRVLSSVLVLHAPRGGYYQSAGTSLEGMAMCASHFLINCIANQLRDEGDETLNLGGADEDSGLARFKEGFGATRMPLPAATYFLGAWWRRKGNRAIRLVLSVRKTLLG